MKIDARELAEVAALQVPARLDMYTGIHKALRALMSDTLLAVGRMDPEDAAETNEISERVVGLMAFCASHLKHENEFKHTAMEARAPGASHRIAHEHDDHERHIAELSAFAAALRACPAPARAGAVLDLYRQLALFIAENYRHMYFEETAHNAVLWATHSDEELLEIYNALVGSIPPDEMMLVVRWMVPYMNPAERTAMLAGMQAGAPAEAFAAVLDAVRPHLTDNEWAKLARSLGLPPVPGLVAV